jgi:NAD(P)-dependent dehydrogenase (short-subunit alcohol dehydrogenase family)
MSEWKDQVVVVTGGAGNLGQAVVQAFYDGGAHVVVIDRQRDIITDTFGETIPEGDYCLYVVANLMDESSVAEAAQKIIDTFGRLDVLVNIAGGFRSGTPIHETPLQTWEFMMDLNAKTVFLMSKAVIPTMLAQGGGKIINIGARAALKGTAKSGPYIASKMAVIRLTETMAAELKGDGINVNCILPGTIDTPANRKDMPNADHAQWVEPASIAGVIQFLASGAARDIHGASVPVYGLS